MQLRRLLLRIIKTKILTNGALRGTLASIPKEVPSMNMPAWIKGKKGGLAIASSLIAVIVILFAWLNQKSIQANTPSVVRIARDRTWFPLNLMGREQNMLAFTNELLFIIAKRLKIDIELLLVPSRDLLTDLDQGRYEAVLAGLTPDAYTRQRYLFSHPFFLLGPVLIVAAKSPVISLSQMELKTVGVMSEVSLVLDVMRLPNFFLNTYYQRVNALDALREGQIDGVLMEALPAYGLVHALYPKSLRIATIPLTQDGMRLVARRFPGAAVFIENFDKELSALRDEGIYKELIDKWGLIDTLKPEPPLS